MMYHSQIDQDRYFVEFIVRGRRGGRFLDVGCHDGVTLSNTLALERDYGWSGICVEADPEVAAQCRAARPGAQVINATVWSRRQWLTLSRPANGQTVLTRIAGLGPNQGYFDEDFTETVDTPVDAVPLAELLPGEQWFDYCSLDVEGAELEALAGIDWSRTAFGFLTIEHGHRPGQLDRLVEFMRRQGYDLHRVNWHDVEFTRPGFPVPPPSSIPPEDAASGSAGR